MKKAILFVLLVSASAAVAQPPIKAKAMSAQLLPDKALYLSYFKDSTETVHQFVLATGIKAGETVEITPEGVKYAGQTYANHFHALKMPKQ